MIRDGLSRSVVSEKHLALASNGDIRDQLKTSYQNGTTFVISEPLGLIAKLAALMPKSRVNLSRFHSADSTFKCIAIRAVHAARNCAHPMAAVRRSGPFRPWNGPSGANVRFHILSD